MATRTKKQESAIPTNLRDLEKRLTGLRKEVEKSAKSARKDVEKSVRRVRKDVEKSATRVRKDVEKTAKRMGREAASYLPKETRRQLDDLYDRVTDLGDSVSKRASSVRADVEDTVEDLRGTVDKRVKALRKDAADSSQKVVSSFEKEARKQVERVLTAVGLPLRSDLDSIKRRVSAIEKRLDLLVEGARRRRARAGEESEAA